MTPEEVLYNWIDAVNQNDVESLVAMYDQESIMTPTFSNKILDTPQKIRQYFEKLVLHEELSNTLHDKTLRIQSINDCIHVLHGIYNFRLKVEGEILNFEARFTFVVDISKSSPIIHHHSSQLPRTI